MELSLRQELNMLKHTNYMQKIKLDRVSQKWNAYMRECKLYEFYCSFGWKIRKIMQKLELIYEKKILMMHTLDEMRKLDIFDEIWINTLLVEYLR